MFAQRTRRPRSSAPMCRDRSIVWWLLMAFVALVVVMLSGEPAMGQTRRSVELMDRALALRPDTSRGRALYQEHCASCHGVDAYGDPGKVVPALAAQLPVYIIKQL